MVFMVIIILSPAALTALTPWVVIAPHGGG